MKIVDLTKIVITGREILDLFATQLVEAGYNLDDTNVYNLDHLKTNINGLSKIPLDSEIFITVAFKK